MSELEKAPMFYGHVDLDLWDDPASIVRYLRNASYRYPAAEPDERNVLRRLADQIEAQTKPPRIPEPGVWGVVEASTESNPYRTTFVRYPSDTEYRWSNAIDTCKSWDFLIDPALIRPGFLGEGRIG
jgi:hypothetical protein